MLVTHSIPEIRLPAKGNEAAPSRAADDNVSPGTCQSSGTAKSHTKEPKDQARLWMTKPICLRAPATKQDLGFRVCLC